MAFEPKQRKCIEEIVRGVLRHQAKHAELELVAVQPLHKAPPRWEILVRDTATKETKVLHRCRDANDYCGSYAAELRKKVAEALLNF